MQNIIHLIIIRFLIDRIEFYRVLPGFTGFYWDLLG